MWRWRLRSCCGRGLMRRRGPAAAALATAGATLFLVWLATASSPPTPRRPDMTIRDPPPTLNSPPTLNPGLVTWVLVDAAGAPGGKVCTGAAGRYPGWWTVLVYGTDQSEHNSLSRCRYLHASAGRTPEEPDDASLPGADLSPAAGAMLHAIKHGAEAIYVPSDTISTNNGNDLRVSTSTSHNSLLYSSPTSEFDAQSHFGCRMSKPSAEGLAPPLMYRNKYKLCKHTTAPFLQVPAHLPGVMEVKQEGKGRTLQMPHCDTLAPPVTLANGVLADVDLHEALYSRNAFWALGVSREVTSLSPPEHRLVVGWALQHLIGMAGGKVAVRYDASLGARRDETTSGRHRHGHTAAAQTIRQWTCGAETKAFSECARDLFTHLGELQLLGRHLVTALNPWWQALEAIGYVWPQIDSVSAPPGAVCKSVVFQPVSLQGWLPWSRYRPHPTLPLSNEQLILETMNANCPKRPEREGKKMKLLETPPVNLTQSWVQLRSVMLIVTFNLDHYDVIPYIELLYRPFFPYIVYCGPGLPDLEIHPKLVDYKLTFLAYKQAAKQHFPGSFHYECLTMAIQLNMAVDGYLVIADDMYVSLTRITEMSLNQAWYLPWKEVRIGDVVSNRECRVGSCDFFPHWRWWEDYKKEILSALKDIEMRQHDSHHFYRCHQQLISLTGKTGRAVGGYSDIYYVPTRLAEDFSQLLELFLKHNVFVEIAVPTTLWCLELPETIALLKGVRIWDETRNRPQDHFNRREYLGRTFLHPTKWSELMTGNSDLRRFYCDSLLPHLHDPYGRLA